MGPVTGYRPAPVHRGISRYFPFLLHRSGNTFPPLGYTLQSSGAPECGVVQAPAPQARRECGQPGNRHHADIPLALVHPSLENRRCTSGYLKTRLSPGRRYYRRIDFEPAELSCVPFTFRFRHLSDLRRVA